jgi:hypothetical protein
MNDDFSVSRLVEDEIDMASLSYAECRGHR